MTADNADTRLRNGPNCRNGPNGLSGLNGPNYPNGPKKSTLPNFRLELRFSEQKKRKSALITDP